MQYKKKIVNDKILEFGRLEYLKKGYKGANISLIAERAGVPVGNLYRYFDGKQGLLDAIVKEPYNNVLRNIEEFISQLEYTCSTKEEAAKKVGEFLDEVYGFYGKDLVILIDKCQKSRYDDFVEKVEKVVAIEVKKQYFSNEQDGEMLGEIIAKAFLSAVFDCMRKSENCEQAKQIFKSISMLFFGNLEIRKSS